MTKIIVGDREDSKQPSFNAHEIILVLENLRSAYNTGNIFRLAEVTQIEKIILCGYTPAPPHPKLNKTARGCDKMVPWEHCDNGETAMIALGEKRVFRLAIETIENAPPIWHIEFRYPLALVFGNEALGISPKTLDKCDAYACLPVFGRKNSLNVANCAAVAVYFALKPLINPLPLIDH